MAKYKKVLWYQRWELNPHELKLNRFSYHYSFHYPHGLWSGLYLHHISRFRCSPSSLYTFPLGLRSVLPFQASPNLRNSTPKVSRWALNFVNFNTLIKVLMSTFEVCHVYHSITPALFNKYSESFRYFQLCVSLFHSISHPPHN